MAIFDNDGTSKFEIGKVYDNDGTVKNQIDKVYDNDGTTNSLIYSSWDGELFLNGEEFTEQTGGYVGDGYIVQWYPVNTLQKGSGVMSFGNPGGDGTSICGTNLPVDITEFNTLVIEYNGSGDFPVYGFGVAASKTITNMAYAVDLKNGINVSTAMDISHLTGSYYIAAYVTRRGIVEIKKIYMK